MAEDTQFLGLNESRKRMSLAEVRQHMLPEEEDGYDAPFATFTWQRWLEMQAQVSQNFSRFLRAIENRRIDIALLEGLEMQEVSTQLLLEACSWIGSVQKK